MKNLGHYSKFIVAAIGVIISGLNNVYGASPDVQLLVSALTALGVYAVPNKPKQV